MLQVLTPTLPAQRQFDTLGNLPAANARCVEIADVDRDGHQDLFLGGTGRGNLLYLNDGSGRFIDATTGRMPAGPRDVIDAAFADFDGDGDQDLICADLGGSHMLLLNDGRGTFTDATKGRLPTQYEHTRGVTTGDVDGDGDLDLVFGIADTTAANRLFLNDGRGTFGYGGLVTDAQYTEAVILVDVDADGDLDLVFCNSQSRNSNRSVWLYLNDGSGRFTNVTDTRMPAIVDQTMDLAVGDIDGDGDPDLVCANYERYGKNGQNRVYLNDGKGTFTDVTAASLPTRLDSTVAVALVDVDKDGDRDLVCGNLSDPFGTQYYNQLYLNDGKGRFTDVTSTRMPGDKADTMAMAVGDLDGDGDPDLVFGNLQSRSRIYWNTGGSFATDRAPAGYLPQIKSQVIGKGDVDGDGDTDLMIGTQLCLNDGHGHFTDESTTRLPTLPQGPWSVALGDVDRDGDLDVVLGYKGQNRLLLNDGKGRFTDATAQLPVDLETTNAIALGDVDGDGDLDLLMANGGRYWDPPEQSRLYLNDGKGRFTDATAGRLPSRMAFTQSLALADVDGDGDLDIAWAHVGTWWHGRAAEQSRLYLNDGKGNFTDVTATQLPAHLDVTRDVVFGDFDGDGDQDLVCGTSYSRDRLYLNDGKGRFSDATATHLPDEVSATGDVLPGDVDGDGDLDLVLVRGYATLKYVAAHPNALYLNDGRGTFTDASHRLPAYDTVSLTGVLFDVDGDLDPDLVVPGDPGGVHLNLLRHLNAPAELRIGQSYSFDVYARYGPASPAIVALPYVAPAPARIHLPSLGTIGLDPAQLVALPPFPVSPTTGVGSLRLPIPNVPGWVGLKVFAQCLVLQDPHAPGLTNVAADTVR